VDRCKEGFTVTAMKTGFIRLECCRKRIHYDNDKGVFRASAEPDWNDREIVLEAVKEYGWAL
jgi:hypothetical protein